MKKIKPFLLVSLCGYVILYLFQLFITLPQFNNTVAINIKIIISVIFSIIPLYYVLNEDKAHAKLLFLFMEIIKIFRMIFEFHFSFLSIFYLFIQLLFCLFLYYVLYKKDRRKQFFSKISYLLILLFCIEILLTSIRYIRANMYLSIIIMIFYYSYKILLVFYCKDK